MIIRELAEILAEARDYRLGFVTLMDVEVAPDLRHAKVYISVLNEEDEVETLQVLKDTKGHYRSELAKRMRVKRTPELHFVIDEVEKRARRMDPIFNEIHEDIERESSSETQLD
jgi:ribosome-binding factor A